MWSLIHSHTKKKRSKKYVYKEKIVSEVSKNAGIDDGRKQGN